MQGNKKIATALISVFDKTGLEPIVKKLAGQSVNIISTGGTRDYIRSLGIEVTPVEDLTSFPSVFGGRVKTLHPVIFGGILQRRDHENDVLEAENFGIGEIDLVIVDLYPFSETLKSGASHEEIIEKIDIGGISLIRAAAKNYSDVIIIPSKGQYKILEEILDQKINATLELRRHLSFQAFRISSNYDSEISDYLANENNFHYSAGPANSLRYGENPHQHGIFYGNLNEVFTKYSGKEISFNNLLDINAALELISDFEGSAVAVLKHNNACGMAIRDNLSVAWKLALQGDPLSAFGGVIVLNRKLNLETAVEIDKIFFEVIMAPGFEDEALKLLTSKKNRIILKINRIPEEGKNFRSLLNGVLVQDPDSITESAADLKSVTSRTANESEIKDMIFANKIVKHSRSNSIVLAKNNQMIGMGCGQTSRVDALKHAISKARENNLDLKGAVMASDAFFPFSDCVEIAGDAGISAIIQPGGSVKDHDSIKACNDRGLSMVFTGYRHFKH